MNQTIFNYGLKPLDRIVVPKSNFKIIQHHALYLGDDHSGQSWIIENKNGIGVRVITAEEFFMNNPLITRIIPFRGTDLLRERGIQIALQKVGLSYDLINYNCESFANQIQLNNIRSKQAENAGVFGLIVLGIFVLFLGNKS